MRESLSASCDDGFAVRGTVTPSRFTDAVNDVIREREGMGNGSGGMPGARYMASREESVELDLLDDRNIARYENEVQRALDRTMPTGEKILMGKTPKILVEYGAADAPMYMAQTAARKAAYGSEVTGGKHGFGAGIVYALPEEMADPIAITRNTTEHERMGDQSIVVWTQYATETGDRIIVPVRIVVDATSGEVYNNVNTVFDVYNQNYLADLLREGNVLYTKNNESIDRLLSQWRQVPEARAGDTLKYSISDSAEKSNTEITGSRSRFDDLTEADRQAAAQRKEEGRKPTERYSAAEDAGEIGEAAYDEQRLAQLQANVEALAPKELRRALTEDRAELQTMEKLMKQNRLTPEARRKISITLLSWLNVIKRHQTAP